MSSHSMATKASRAVAAAICSAALLTTPVLAAEPAGSGDPAGGTAPLEGSWHSREDRQGVTAAWDNGSLTITTSYYSVQLPSEWASLGASFCYDEDMFALTGDPQNPEDRSSWSWIACDLLVSIPDEASDRSNLAGVYLARAGEDIEVLLSASQGSVGKVVGDAAVGDGWVVVAYALYSPGDKDDEQRALSMLDILAACTAPRGSSTQPPAESDGFQVVLGG